MRKFMFAAILMVAGCEKSGPATVEPDVDVSVEIGPAVDASSDVTAADVAVAVSPADAPSAVTP